MGFLRRYRWMLVGAIVSGAVAAIFLLSPLGIMVAIAGAFIGHYFDGQGRTPDPRQQTNPQGQGTFVGAVVSVALGLGITVVALVVLATLF